LDPSSPVFSSLSLHDALPILISTAEALTILGQCGLGWWASMPVFHGTHPVSPVMIRPGPRNRSVTPGASAPGRQAVHSTTPATFRVRLPATPNRDADTVLA